MMGNTVRIGFPIAMFVLAGVSFAYGAYQHFAAAALRANGVETLSFIMETIEESDASRASKQEVYTAVASGLPTIPPVLGIDFSGSFAAPDTTDQCTSDGQRSLCRALRVGEAGGSTYDAVCGSCNPQ